MKPFVPGRWAEVFFVEIASWVPGIIIDRQGTFLIRQDWHPLWGGARLARTEWTRLRDPVEVFEGDEHVGT